MKSGADRAGTARSAASGPGNTRAMRRSRAHWQLTLDGRDGVITLTDPTQRTGLTSHFTRENARCALTFQS